MGKKDCCFQYATGDGLVLEDSDLISSQEAERLWDKYIPQFKKHFEAGRNPEMAIWIKMKNSDDYHTTGKHWNSESIEMRNGALYELVYLG